MSQGISITVEDFINGVLKSDLKTMIETEGLHYLSFVVMAPAVELLGALARNEPLESTGLSEARIKRGLEFFTGRKYQRLINRGANGSRQFFQSLRCPMVHRFQPSGDFAICTRSEAAKWGVTHLNESTEGKLIIVAEEFYDDLCNAFDSYLTQSKLGKLPVDRSQQVFLNVTYGTSAAPVGFGESIVVPPPLDDEGNAKCASDNALDRSTSSSSPM